MKVRPVRGYQTRLFLVLGLGMLLAGTNWAQQADIPQLLKTAQEGRPKQQYAAIDDLGELHRSASTVVPGLVGLLGDADLQVRWRAARSLGDYGSLAAEAVPALRKMLATDKPLAKMHAAAALGRIGDPSEATVRALLTLVTDADARVARVAIAAIRTLQPDPALTAKALASALRSNDQAVTSHAIEAIIEAGAKTVPLLREALRQPETAYLACVAIEEIGPDAAETVPELIALLKDTSHSQLHVAALLALAKIGPAAKSAAPTILPLLESKQDATVPVAAAYALGAVGASEANGPLRKAAALKQKPFLTMVASWSLAKLNPNNQQEVSEAIRRLTKGLGSDNAKIRATAAHGLRALGAPAEEVAPELLKIANDADPAVRANVRSALAGLGPEIVPRLVTALENPELRDLAVDVVIQMGPQAAAAVQPLAEVLNSGLDATQRADVHLALAAIGPAAAPATGALLPALTSDEPRVRHTAMRALHEIGSGAAAAREPLLALISGEDQVDAAVAAWALAAIARQDAEVMARTLPVLQRNLSHAGEDVRVRSAEALGLMGPAARPAVSQLKKVAQEDDRPAVRDAASAALEQISGE